MDELLTISIRVDFTVPYTEDKSGMTHEQLIEEILRHTKEERQKFVIEAKIIAIKLLNGELLKTAIIWNEIDQLKYAIEDGDWRKFDGVYINVSDDNKLANELTSKCFDAEGNCLLHFVSLSEFANAIRDGLTQFEIEAGIIP